MTREEAWRRTKGYLYDVLSGEEADEIIKALEQEPCDDMEKEYEKTKALFSKVVKSDDCISRQAVLDINERHHEQMPNNINHKICQEIKDLPSVQSNRGHWIEHEESITTSFKHLRECSCCKCYFDWLMPRNSYCPNCGAKMESEG